jgi:hypothetical protein
MTTDTPYDGTERRRYPRIRAELMVSLEAIELPGPRTSAGWIALTGFTKDLSLGGVLLSLHEEVDVGIECMVLLDAQRDQIAPRTSRGTVLRVVKRNSVFDVAVEFSQPLDVLNLPSDSR